MSSNIRSIIKELKEIFVQSGFIVLPLEHHSGYGFTGSDHISIDYNKELNDFVDDIIQSISIFLGHSRDYQKFSDFTTKEYISITISAEPIFMTDGSIKLK